MKFGLTISLIAHALLLLWALVSFSAKPLDAKAPDSVPVDIISDTQFSQMMKGNKDAPKAETPKPQVDKVEEPKPVEQTVPPVTKKDDVKPIAKQEPEPQPPEQKPPEKVEKVEKKEPPKPDPIAEAIKKDEAKQRADAKAKAKADAAKKQPKFNPNEIAALLDKRDAQRKVATGDTPNQETSLGTTTGSAPALSQSEIEALRQRLMQLWNPPAGARNPDELVVRVRIKLGRDRKLASPPIVMTSGRGSLFEAARDGAIRALFQGQPYEMLKMENYELWKEMEITFDPREMAG
jgi:outer membrane biosynthesis protein TonB